MCIVFLHTIPMQSSIKGMQLWAISFAVNSSGGKQQAELPSAINEVKMEYSLLTEHWLTLRSEQACGKFAVCHAWAYWTLFLFFSGNQPKNGFLWLRSGSVTQALSNMEGSVCKYDD